MNKNKLKAKCVEKGMNIEMLANKIGVHKTTFYRYMDNGNFTIKHVRLIIKHLSLNEEEIMSIFFENTFA